MSEIGDNSFTLLPKRRKNSDHGKHTIKITEPLKYPAEEAYRRITSPSHGTMFVPAFYENRARKNISKCQEAPIEKVKNKLHKLFNGSEQPAHQ